MTRNYLAETSGAQTVTVQIQAKGRLKRIVIGGKYDAAAGAIEVSTSPSSQIGTAQPAPTVLARSKFSGATQSGGAVEAYDMDVPVEAFQNIYCFQTGAANVCVVTLTVSENK